VEKRLLHLGKFELIRLPRLLGIIRAVAISSDNKYIVSGSEDYSIKIFICERPQFYLLID